MKHFLVHIINPLGVIAALAAIRTRHPDANCEIVFLCHWPAHGSAVISKEVAAVVESMTCKIPERRRITILNADHLSEFLKLGCMTQACAMFRKLLRMPNVDEIYYSHDVVGVLCQFLAAAYPAAARICYGDVLGFVGRKDARLAIMRRPPCVSKVCLSTPSSAMVFLERNSEAISHYVNSLARELGQDLFNALYSVSLRPTEATLVLPVDQFGGFDRDIPIRIVPKEIVLKVLTDCRRGVDRLQIYSETLLQRIKGEHLYLLLTENFAEAKDLDFKQDVQMFCAVVRRECPPKSIVLIKSHPGETMPRGQMIIAQLKDDFTVIELDNSLKRYPIELWSELIEHTQPICASYPSISIKYIYNKFVRHPFDDHFIEKWWPPEKQAFRKDSLRWITSTSEALDTWTGKGFVYQGDIVQ